MRRKHAGDADIGARGSLQPTARQGESEFRDGHIDGGFIQADAEGTICGEPQI